jgi:hypothetical protein
VVKAETIQRPIQQNPSQEGLTDNKRAWVRIFLKNFIEKQMDKKRRGAEEHTAKGCRLNFETGGISHVSK